MICAVAMDQERRHTSSRVLKVGTCLLTLLTCIEVQRAAEVQGRSKTGNLRRAALLRSMSHGWTLLWLLDSLLGLCGAAERVMQRSGSQLVCQLL
jgi:hypothetical protein